MMRRINRDEDNDEDDEDEMDMQHYKTRRPPIKNSSPYQVPVGRGPPLSHHSEVFNDSFDLSLSYFKSHAYLLEVKSSLRWLRLSPEKLFCGN